MAKPPESADLPRPAAHARPEDNPTGISGEAGAPMVIDGWPGLQRAATAGPFFEVLRWPERLIGTDDAWYPMTDFAEHPLGLGLRVASARDALMARGFGVAGASPAVVLRVAASVSFLGLAARLLSPALGSAVIAGVAPDLSWDRLYWRPAATGVLPLAADAVPGRAIAGSPSRAGREGGAHFVFATTVAPVLALGSVVSDRFRVPARVVGGNVASALVGALQASTRTAQPLSAAAATLAVDLLGRPELAGAGTFLGPVGLAGSLRFRRLSCCLLYRVDGAGLCGDCVLHRSPLPRVPGIGGT